MYGDADISGVLTAADSAMVLQKVLNDSFKMSVEDVKKDYMSVVDADQNKVLTAADSTVILQKVLNDSFRMPIESQ